MRIELENGKYTYIHDESGSQYALRYGEPWRDLTGDKFVYCMADKIEQQAERIEKQYAALKLARETLEGMKRWFDAEEDHADTTFEERCCMCNVVQATVPEALAAIDALGDAK